MKMKLLASLVAALMITAATAIPVLADDTTKSGDIPIGSSNEVEMVGIVEPTIMSVTVPTHVPFHVSRTLEGQNKVISPRITITNNSSVPVNLNVTYTKVDLSRLRGTTWSNGGYIGANQIAIGFQEEKINNKVPTGLENTKWLQNSYQHMNLMSLNAYGNSSMYVVGSLGDLVPENNSFSVIPTIVVERAS